MNNIKSQSLDGVRLNYSKSVTDKNLCQEMITELSNVKNSSATHLAYLGSLQTIWANHVFNPISKLNTFKKGKQNIELAIQKEPNNVEIRYIRLSVQKNIPAFLGYQSSIQRDTEFITKHLHEVKSLVLQKNIKTLLNP